MFLVEKIESSRRKNLEQNSYFFKKIKERKGYLL